ncbi:hypothetical protein [Phenylobacterium sp.]|jgi:hypothetical protein|uniref:hypothetical protein n=1 Tax=Phenylobacterium sp. TaxID=1871053 RepID=UPI002E307FA2|nr:hypothetical protein [Phenylobacterium sp.]HEX3366817.1 hypothetical protein [Phenylobacterium sp.]
MNVDDARDDLAFIRALVAPEDHWQRQFGKLYAAAGACYSVQMLLHIGQFAGITPNDGLGAQLIGWGPSVVFLAILIWVIRRDGPQRSGLTSRAVGAVFAAVGMTNLALCLTIGSVALRLHSLTLWLIYPCVVMILQGLAWMVAFMLRRRGWLGLVAVGWFGVGVAMAVFIDNMVGYVAAATVGVVCFMLIPGLYLMRQAGRDA